jgi:nucleotide-binding universal stress UspA family protein
MSIVQPTGAGTVVVGVDGSEQSRQALEFAAEDARRRGASLRVVTAYDATEGEWLVAHGGPPLDADARHTVVDNAVDAIVTEVLGAGAAVPSVQVSVLPGPAAAVLVREAAGADLLVVGSRGLGGFRGLALGSVSQQCVLHAPCPVTVVHQPKPVAVHAPARTAARPAPISPLY